MKSDKEIKPKKDVKKTVKEMTARLDALNIPLKTMIDLYKEFIADKDIAAELRKPPAEQKIKTIVSSWSIEKKQKFNLLEQAYLDVASKYEALVKERDELVGAKKKNESKLTDLNVKLNVFGGLLRMDTTTDSLRKSEERPKKIQNFIDSINNNTMANLKDIPTIIERKLIGLEVSREKAMTLENSDQAKVILTAAQSRTEFLMRLSVELEKENANASEIFKKFYNELKPQAEAIKKHGSTGTAMADLIAQLIDTLEANINKELSKTVAKTLIESVIDLKNKVSFLQASLKESDMSRQVRSMASVAIKASSPPSSASSSSTSSASSSTRSSAESISNPESHSTVEKPLSTSTAKVTTWIRSSAPRNVETGSQKPQSSNEQTVASTPPLSSSTDNKNNQSPTVEKEKTVEVNAENIYKPRR